MDSSYWTNLNLLISVKPTKKQYYGRYLWRLVYDISMVYLASDKLITDINKFVKIKKVVDVGQQRDNFWARVDEELIDRVRTVMIKYKHMAKFRTEHHTLQVYTENEDDLRLINAEINGDDYLSTINMPIPGTEQALRDGHIFMNKIGYKYKITMRDGNYPAPIKENILSQLTQRDDVRLPALLRRELSKKYPALWGGYFYANDDSIVTILSLISPGCIGNIHPIDHLQ